MTTNGSLHPMNFSEHGTLKETVLPHASKLAFIETGLLHDILLPHNQNGRGVDKQCRV